MFKIKFANANVLIIGHVNSRDMNYDYEILDNSQLTYYSPMLLFSTPLKHQKTFRFSDVFRGYRKASPGCNGLQKNHDSAQFL